jgi:hypothetical protein
MVKFAHSCLKKFNALVSELATQLGPDTRDLKLRVGLHSGPVTAGVLRGRKSRFQRLRQLVVNSIIATDVIDKELKEDRNSRWERAFVEGSPLLAEARAASQTHIVNR